MKIPFIIFLRVSALFLRSVTAAHGMPLSAHGPPWPQGPDYLLLENNKK